MSFIRLTPHNARWSTYFVDFERHISHMREAHALLRAALKARQQ